MESIQIPDKVYFKIGEVAKLLDVEPYVLRYWETEFEQVRPQKTKSGQRCYQRREIETLLVIKGLLYQEMFTIAGARRQLKTNRQVQLPLGEPARDEDLRAQLESAQSDNKELSERLSTLELDRDALLESNEVLSSRNGELRPEGEVLAALERVSALELENARLQEERLAIVDAHEESRVEASRLTQLELENARLQEERLAVQEESRAEASRLAQLELENARLQEERLAIADAQEDNQADASRLAELEIEYTKLQEERSALLESQSAVMADASRVSDLEAENAQLRKEQLGLRASLVARQQRRRSAISSARRELESLQTLAR